MSGTIYSMTGFAACETGVATGTLIVELRAVNHRYLELHLRMDDALRSFEQGKSEVLELVFDERGPQHRYMAPLVVKKACLNCHADQGYRLGDIRGGISVSPGYAYERAPDQEHFLFQ